MSKKNVYFVLAILGLLLPYGVFVPWLLENGLDVQLFFSEMLSNEVAKTTALDFLMVTIAVVTFIVFESKKLEMRYMVIPILATFVAVGFGLALFLCLRERHFENEQNQHSNF